MSTEQQELWLRAAADALVDIRPSEVAAISAESRRTVTRPSQIVPEIAKLVAEKRKRPAYSETVPENHEFQIDMEAQRRRGIARTQAEIEDAWAWERSERIKVGLRVAPIEPPFTRAEIDKLAPSMIAMGLKCGALVRRDGQIVNGR